LTATNTFNMFDIKPGLLVYLNARTQNKPII